MRIIRKKDKDGKIKISFGRDPKSRKSIVAVFVLATALLSGCGDESAENEITQVAVEKTTGISHETASDARIEFDILRSENPDIFAWLYIPETGIDYPVLQSEEGDDHYETHDAYGKESERGALYTELANLKNMCDFNTVVHGKAVSGSPFEDLYQYTDPDFFREHEEFYIYLDDNLLTYVVFAAFERENTSLIRTYDFTYLEGCGKFLDDLYQAREMGKQVREGWEGVTPYNFLVTLTAQNPADPHRQLVVVGVLTEDASGNIDRLINE